jgi:hypothetical protein
MTDPRHLLLVGTAPAWGRPSRAGSRVRDTA